MYVVKRNQIILTALVAYGCCCRISKFSEKNQSQSGEVATVLSDEADAYGLMMTEGAIDTIADDVEDVGATDPLTAEATKDTLTAEAKN